MTSSRSTGSQLLALMVLVLVSAGGGSRAGQVAVVAEATAAEVKLFRGAGVVLESPQHGPQLCTAVAESRPPSCQGLDIAGWSWDTVEAESVGGTTWGSFAVVGTWSAGTSTLTLTEPAVADDGTGSSTAADAGFTTLGPAELEAVQAAVMSDRPDVVSSWLDPSAGQVVVEVDVATAAEQQDLDARFGIGVVRLTGSLRHRP